MVNSMQPKCHDLNNNNKMEDYVTSKTGVRLLLLWVELELNSSLR